MANVQITFGTNKKGFPTPAVLKQKLVAVSNRIATRMSEHYANQLKFTLLKVRAFATGDTHKSVKDEMVLVSPSRGLVMRRVIASRNIVNIQLGRAAGLKAPPVASLERWAAALGIPKSALLPIARSIGKKGVKPREVQEKAVKASQAGWKQAIQTYMGAFVRDILK